MLLNGAKQQAIIDKMKYAHPGEPELNKSNLSRHYHNHLITQPIKTTETDPETGEVREGFIVGHLTQHIAVPKEAVPPPEERISIPDALAVIINAGVRNAIVNPASVSPKDLLAAIEIARKLGLRGDDDEEFRDAWKALGEAKSGGNTRKSKRRRKVTVEEEETVEERGGRPAEVISRKPGEPEVIDAEVVTPAEGWSDEEMGLLPPGEE
jgi:hypothetical protein